ncbi:MAG: hypothetical protein K0R09_3272 [Clostridiales bacterium]|nr:hypothetical protein [Clostridiales bacterium]
MKKKAKKAATSKKVKRYSINKSLRNVLVILSVVAFLFCTYMIFITQKYQKYTEVKHSVYSYSNKSYVNYEVILLPNNIYTQKSIEEGSIYITKLIDYINTSFKYEFSGEKIAQINGKYNVIAVLEGFLPGDSIDKAIWRKEYTLQPDIEFKEEDKRVYIEGKTPINIKSYFAFIEAASQTAEINFLTKLSIKWNVSMEAKTDKGIIKEKLSPTMEIPLGSKYFQVGGILSEEKPGNIEETMNIISPFYNKKLVFYSVASGISFIALLFILLFTAKKAMLTTLDKIRKQIFKEHGSRLAGICSDVTSLSKVLIEVLSIDDLVKIADDIGRPILYKNNINEGEINNFYIIDEEKIYMLNIGEKSTKSIIKENNVNNVDVSSINI